MFTDLKKFFHQKIEWNKLPADTDFFSLSKFKRIITTMDFSDYLQWLVVSRLHERTIAIRKCKFLNKFSVIYNALCMVFVTIAKTELESFCTDV